jgi:hypothetical protein
MKFNIVFNNSGDMLPFTAINPDLLCYLLDQIDSLDQNTFTPENNNHGIQTLDKIKSLQTNLKDVNKWLENLSAKIYPELDNLFDHLDQDFLNHCHDFWVNSKSQTYDINHKKQFPTPFSKKIEDVFPDSIPFPKLSSVISRIGLSQQYNQINLDIHALEDAFSRIQFSIKTVDWVEWDNPYPMLVNNDICNLYMDYKHVGRLLMDKYESFDFDLKYNDENSFLQILPIIGLSLRQPRKIPYSPEYIDWCKTKNREPVGIHMPLGNIPNLYEKLKEYRTIIIKNLLDNNGFTLQKDGN